jgi:hypothetical protein
VPSVPVKDEPIDAFPGLSAIHTGDHWEELRHRHGKKSHDVTIVKNRESPLDLRFVVADRRLRGVGADPAMRGKDVVVGGKSGGAPVQDVGSCARQEDGAAGVAMDINRAPIRIGADRLNVNLPVAARLFQNDDRVFGGMFL